MPDFIRRLRRDRDRAVRSSPEVLRRGIATPELASPPTDRPPLVIHAPRADSIERGPTAPPSTTH